MAARASLVVVAACGPGAHPAMIDSDAATDASTGRGDLRGETSVQMPSCQTARTICVGGHVHGCREGVPGPMLEVCESTCSLGRCTTPACADAESSGGLHGCRFYGVQLDNVDSEDARNMSLLVTNPGALPVKARVEIRGEEGVWRVLNEAIVQPMTGDSIVFSRPVPRTGVTPAGGFRVEADGPVMVVQIINDDGDRAARSSGGTVLRPAQALGRGHIAVTSPARLTTDGMVPDGAAAVGSRNGASVITVIATAPDTSVAVGLTAQAMVQPGDQFVPSSANLDVRLMNEGDVLNIVSTAPEGDLTGTTIDSDLPVAVFSGNVFTSYEFPLTGFHGSDLTEEQLPPTASWGSEYVGVRLSPQVGCDPFFGAGVARWTVVAAQDNTTVSLFSASTVSIDGPNLTSTKRFTLMAGGFQSFATRSQLGAFSPADVLVDADKPILLAQWLDCEPGLAWGIDTRLSSGPFWFSLPKGFDHEVVVLRKIGDALSLDGRPQPPGLFTRVSGDAEFEVVRLGPVDLDRCEGSSDDCAHVLVGPALGVSMRGMDVVCSHALTVPSAQMCVLPNVVCPR